MIISSETKKKKKKTGWLVVNNLVVFQRMTERNLKVYLQSIVFKKTKQNKKKFFFLSLPMETGTK